MEIWEEPVRGGYPPLWMMGLSGQERNEIWETHAPVPPIAYLTGCRPTEFEIGESRSVMPASPWLQSPQGRIPLGALAILADLAFGTCYGSSLPPGGGFTTAELSLTRVQETRPGGDLVGHGRLVHAGDSSVLTEARVYDPEGRLVAAGLSRPACRGLPSFLRHPSCLLSPIQCQSPSGPLTTRLIPGSATARAVCWRRPTGEGGRGSRSWRRR